MFWFKPDKPANNTAGQFTELRLPHDEVDERGDKRWFTMTSSPTEPLVAITTRLAGQKGSSFKRTLAALEPGAEVNLAEPMGDFVLPKDKSIPLVFVAGGIGITPMRSMVKWLTDVGEKRDIHLIYGVRSPEDAVFKDLFDAYGVRVDLITNRLSAEKILELTGTPEGKLIYLSGPEPMIETLFKDLKKLGIRHRQLVTDYFPGYTTV